jgi:hypothetical protein
MNMRYDPGFQDGDFKGLNRYAHCQWCNGKGCLQCEREADEAYKRAFPNGPQPIATFRIPEDMDVAKEVISQDAINHAFGPEGRGVDEIADNFKRAMETRQTE